jgi:hypothetical protein
MSFGSESTERDAQERRKTEQWGVILKSWRQGRGCPDDEEVAAFCEGRLPLMRRARVWWHSRSCVFCRSEIFTLREVMEFSPALPGRAAWQWIRIPAILVAGLLIFGGAYEIRQATVRRSADREEAAARENVIKLIGIASDDTQAVLRLTHASSGEELRASAQLIGRDADELRIGKARWERALTRRARERDDSDLRASLQVTQAAMSQLDLALAGYAKLEGVLVDPIRKGPGEYVLASSGQQVLAELHTAEALLRKE